MKKWPYSNHNILSEDVSYGTYALHVSLSQTATFNIECLKWDLKDSPKCLDLTYFLPQNKTVK